MHVHDQILQFIRTTGPTIPARVGRHIKTELLFASAHLADLASQGKIKVSNLKLGGSPLYYLQGQEEQLYNFAQDNLNPKDFTVLSRLKEVKVLRESDLDLLSKVALRTIKDFAIPLQVRVKDTVSLFWKWHLTSDEEVTGLISSILKEEGVAQAKQAAQETIPPQHLSVPSTPIAPIENTSSPISSETKPQKQELEVTQAKKVKRREKVVEDGKQEKLEKINEPVVIENKVSAYPPPEKDSSLSLDPFFILTDTFMKKMNINVQEGVVMRKNSELNLIIKVPSVVGEVTYYCKAKKKSKCDEKDLSTAFMEARLKKLPLLFLYTNDLTKKANELIANSVNLENIIVKKIE